MFVITIIGNQLIFTYLPTSKITAAVKTTRLFGRESEDVQEVTKSESHLDTWIVHLHVTGNITSSDMQPLTLILGHFPYATS